MSEIQDFELGTILTMTTEYSCVDDFSKVYELVWFVCDDPFINDFGLCLLKDRIKDHLLEIHPELANVRFKEGNDIHKFMAKQEEKFGKVLPVSKLGEELPEEYRVNISSNNPFNVSEVIATLKDFFKSDPSKVKEFSAKYEKFQSRGPVKRLKKVRRKGR